MRLLLSLTDQSFAATKSVGIFNVSLGLARGLATLPEISELHLLVNKECGEHFADMPDHVKLHLQDKAVPSRWSRVWWDQWEVSSVIRSIAPDWAVLPKGFAPFFPRMGKTKLACYVHDVIWEYYEGKADKEGNPFPPAQLRYFKTLGLRTLRKADLVLTSTRFNESRFHAYAPHSKTAVVGIGFDTPCSAPTAKRGTDILFFASAFPHKLTAMGIQRLEAWLRQRADAGDIRIHVIGACNSADSAGLSPNWHLCGRIPGAELQELMNRKCRAAVYCSAYEGFGMPPVECLRAGIPCVASDIPPIRENIPPRFLFDNASEASFIATLNAAYDNADMNALPAFPTWEEVAQRAVQAMQVNI